MTIGLTDPPARLPLRRRSGILSNTAARRAKEPRFSRRQGLRRLLLSDRGSRAPNVHGAAAVPRNEEPMLAPGWLTLADASGESDRPLTRTGTIGSPRLRYSRRVRGRDGWRPPNCALPTTDGCRETTADSRRRASLNGRSGLLAWLRNVDRKRSNHFRGRGEVGSGGIGPQLRRSRRGWWATAWDWQRNTT